MSETDPQSGSASPSIRSQASHSSQNQIQPGAHSHASLQRLPRLPLAPRQSSVSMFTGLSNVENARTSNPDGGNITPVTSPGSVDRVFPIRSAVSIDPNATPMYRSESLEGYPGLVGYPDSAANSRKGGTSDVDERSDFPRSPSGSETFRIPDHSYPRRKSLSKDSEGGIGPINGFGRRSSLMSNQSSLRMDPNILTNIISDDARSIKSGLSGRSDARSSQSGGPTAAHSSVGSATGMNKDEQPLMTARFKHVVTDGGHAVITGRDGETLQRCEDEPIHIPGAIQSFGLLLAFREENGKLLVRVASENSQRIIGYSPQQLFRLNTLTDIFSEEQADNLLDHLDFIRDEESSDVVANGPEVFMISIRPPHHRSRKLWCAMHLCPGDKEIVICEFEMEDDLINPLVPTDSLTPEPPEDTLGSEPSPEELAESTVNVSKPLRVLRSARKKRGEAAAMEVFNIMSQVQEQLANAPTLPVFLKVLIGVVKELIGFHRVMIYQFDQAWNGRVVAELVDTRATKDLYKGLNFPASDIPKQARDLYKLNKVRLLYDRDQETARLVCRTMEDLEKPLDLTHCYLRAMSPIHLKYLANMAVRSSMSISINAFNELWGLIACHTYGSKPMRVSFPIRKMCRLVGDTASRNIERLSYASRLQARKLINTTSSAANPSGYIVASSEDLLRLFDADVGALSIRDETKIMGNSSGNVQEILAMVEFLRMKRINTVFTSQDIATDFPDLRYEPGLKFLAGVLYVPLSNGGNDFIAFFRQGVLQEVKWAGNPYEKFVKEGTEGYLEPRKSFKQWSEVIIGRCRDWSEEEIETASVLCLVYGKFIDVWRQKEAALQNSQLTKLLLANSAHEVRTPLNAIINYLEIALEGTLDQETRENLAKSHSASKSLVYVINDLLDLTKTEENNSLVKEEVFDLHATLGEATDPFVGDARRKKLTYTVKIDQSTPREVIGDHRRVRQIVSNLIANAIQHTSSGSVSVCAMPIFDQGSPNRCEMEISVQDTGSGMSSNKVDALFQELEEVSYEQAASAQKLLDQHPFENESDGDAQSTLGLGLAVVARTIRNMNGQLRLKTEEGKGSKFIIVLGFELAKSSLPPESREALPAPVPTRSGQTGEVTLVKRSSSLSQRSTPVSISRKESVESVRSAAGGSVKSTKSGNSAHSNRSDADRLIDAIQEPLRLHDSLDSASESSRTRHKLVRSYSTEAPSSFTPLSPQKSRSVASTKDLRSAFARIPGQENVQDSGTPLRPVKVPEIERSEKDNLKRQSVKFQDMEPPLVVTPGEMDEKILDDGKFSVLVAEDDPINSRIMKKRLEKLGHTAYMTVNGEECSSAYGEQATTFDAVLMDLQMPIVDGFSSTKMIRSFEKTKSSASLSQRAAMNGRIPIFAVSASLIEKDKEKYIMSGFDGWILKPVDFKRVDQMLKGIADLEIRNGCLYRPGHWEQGGWFEMRRPKDQYEVDTHPSGEGPTAQTQHQESDQGNIVAEKGGEDLSVSQSDESTIAAVADQP